MHTVLTRRRYTFRTTAHDLRVLMRDQGVTPAALAWILHIPLRRAIGLRYWSTAWTVREVFALMAATAPASRAVPVLGGLGDRDSRVAA